MDERDELDRGYVRVRLTMIVLAVAASALTAVAMSVDLAAAGPVVPPVYRWIFLAAAIVAGVSTLLFHNDLAGARPLRRPPEGRPAPSVASQVATLASVLLAIPFAVLLLGFVLRVVLGGSVLDYLGFLAVTLALWALFFPRRTEYEHWVEMRTGGQE